MLLYKLQIIDTEKPDDYRELNVIESFNTYDAEKVIETVKFRNSEINDEVLD